MNHGIHGTHGKGEAKSCPRIRRIHTNQNGRRAGADCHRVTETGAVREQGAELTLHITGGGPATCDTKQHQNPAVQCMCRVSASAHHRLRLPYHRP